MSRRAGDEFATDFHGPLGGSTFALAFHHRRQRLDVNA